MFLSGSEVKDITSGFIITNKSYLKNADFERWRIRRIFYKKWLFATTSKLNIYELGYLCETRIYGESKTGTNLIKLILENSYIKVALKYKSTYEDL